MGYSNLAYKNWAEEEEIVVTKSRVEPKKKNVRNFKPIIYVLVLSVAAYYMISKSVVLYETNQEIKQKQAELTELETYTSQRTFELEQSVDLATVEEIAASKLNMQRPESYQIEYVSRNRDDVTEVTADEVEGVKNKVGKAAESFRRNIVGIFTIRGK